jgi:hypothetical protein
MKAISNTLIHFLGKKYKDNPASQFTIFEKIIREGLMLSPMVTKFGKEQVNIICVSFTDIPLSFCDDHVSVYGKFGIGFKKSLIKDAGGNPARYFVDSYMVTHTAKSKGTLRGIVLSYMEELIRSNNLLRDKLADKSGMLLDKNGREIIDVSILKTINQRIIDILSFEKEMGDLGAAREDDIYGDTYYKEREWRVIQLNLSAEDAKKDLFGQSNDATFINFTKDDIRFIIVPDESLRKQVTEFFLKLRKDADARLKQFGQDILPILVYDQLKFI